MKNNTPNSIVKDMYLQITNFAQGVNLAALVLVVVNDGVKSSTSTNMYVLALYALVNFFIVIILGLSLRNED